MTTQTQTDDDAEDDLPTQITRLLRNVEGVHTVYGTQGIVPSIVTAVVEAIRRDEVGMHLVTVRDGAAGREVLVHIGVTDTQGAPEVCRRAHDAIRDFFVGQGHEAPAHIHVKVGRVG